MKFVFFLFNFNDDTSSEVCLIDKMQRMRKVFMVMRWICCTSNTIAYTLRHKIAIWRLRSNSSDCEHAYRHQHTHASEPHTHTHSTRIDRQHTVGRCAVSKHENRVLPKSTIWLCCVCVLFAPSLLLSISLFLSRSTQQKCQAIVRHTTTNKISHFVSLCCCCCKKKNWKKPGAFATTTTTT